MNLSGNASIPNTHTVFAKQEIASTSGLNANFSMPKKEPVSDIIQEKSMGRRFS
jgi:hypothetical protein